MRGDRDQRKRRTEEGRWRGGGGLIHVGRAFSRNDPRHRLKVETPFFFLQGGRNFGGNQILFHRRWNYFPPGAGFSEIKRCPRGTGRRAVMKRRWFTNDFRSFKPPFPPIRIKRHIFGDFIVVLFASFIYFPFVYAEKRINQGVTPPSPSLIRFIFFFSFVTKM